MGLFSFLQTKKSLDPVSLASLGTDVHSHLLPGIDDGAKTMDHTLGMLRRFEELGYRKLITTPHVMPGVYNNTSELILQKLEEVREAAGNAGISLELEASAEYYFDETLFDRIRKRDFLTFAGTHVLFECSFRSEPNQLEQLVFEMKTSGYQPVIAHFERYGYYHGSTDMAKRLRDMGALIQLNLNSLTGHYGPEVRKQGIRLIEDKLIDVAGTDCHRMEHLTLLEKHLAEEPFHRLMELPLLNSQW